MKYYFLTLFFLMASCGEKSKKDIPKISKQTTSEISKVTLHVLGTVQDGGSPHIGCKKECCAHLFKNPDNSRKVVSLGIVDHENQLSFLFEATPDITSQVKLLKKYSNAIRETPNGIFLTHAHIGHYTGLMYLGREAMGAKQVKVHSMPKMKEFLENNGPWDQLVKLENIEIQPMENEKAVNLTSHLNVIPFTVPHRDEYSETVGFKIMGPDKSALFIPDIDKWSKWNKDIIEEIRKVDLAFLDATFFDGVEISARNIDEIPHPFVVESMELFKDLSKKEKSKIYFIHFNHTNPLLDINSDAYRKVLQEGFNIAHFEQEFSM